MAKEIHQLTQSFRKLAGKLSTKKPKGKRSKKRGSSRRPAGGRDLFPRAAAGTSSRVLAHPAVQANDPHAVSVAAQIAPFSVPKGVAKKLTENYHSQAVTARGVDTITVATNNTLLFWIENCASNDIAGASLCAVVCPTANLGDATSTISSSTVGVNPANCTTYPMSTRTPYSYNALAGNDYMWRVVGAGLRVRNVSEQLYRGGILRYVGDTQGTLNGSVSCSSTSFAAIIDLINTAQHSVRKHFSDDSLVEILVPHAKTGWGTTNKGAVDGLFMGATMVMTNGVANTNANYPSSGAAATRFGGTTSSYSCGMAPLIWGYFTNTSQGSQMLDLELVEHYEFHGTEISTLHTPSANHVQSQDLIENVVEHVVTNHSNNPHLHYKDVLKEAVKLAHNKQAVKDASVAASIALAL